MKYGKSSLPYVTLLLILLIGMPLANWQMSKGEQVIVKVTVEKYTMNKQIVSNMGDESKSILSTSK